MTDGGILAQDLPAGFSAQDTQVTKIRLSSAMNHDDTPRLETSLVLVLVGPAVLPIRATASVVTSVIVLHRPGSFLYQDSGPKNVIGVMSRPGNLNDK